jgi:hypothetical protein
MSESTGTPVPDQGTLARAVGIIVSPGQTFRAVVQSPRPVIMLLLVAVVIGLATALPQLTERGRQAALDMQVQQTERLMGPITPEMYAGMAERMKYGAYITFASTFVILPIMTLLLTAVFWFVFNAVLGGTATFKQVLGVNTHAQVIGALGAVLGAPVMYMQDSFTQAGPFTLSALAGMVEPGSFLANFLGGIGIFQIWGLIVTAIGLGILYRRKTTGIAITLIVVYMVIVAGFAAFFSSLGAR